MADIRVEVQMVTSSLPNADVHCGRIPRRELVLPNHPVMSCKRLSDIVLILDLSIR